MEVTKGRVLLVERSGICGYKDPEKGRNGVCSSKSKNDHVA